MKRVIEKIGKRYGKPRVRRGFTLVEIMIVVGIIGVLLLVAIPAYRNVSHRARIILYIRNLKTIVAAFNMYAADNDTFPPDTNPGVKPDGIEEYLNKFNWDISTPLGGKWDWDNQASGIKLGISVVGDGFDSVSFIEVDQRIDNGDLDTGSFRRMAANRYTFILEE